MHFLKVNGAREVREEWLYNDNKQNRNQILRNKNENEN